MKMKLYLNHNKINYMRYNRALDEVLGVISIPQIEIYIFLKTFWQNYLLVFIIEFMK